MKSILKYLRHDSEIRDNSADSLGIAFSQDIRPLIDAIDNLRRFGLQQDIDLPNVVVVGDQSSGKSSIIEAISGIELPRGKNIVTRCPLELQLKKVVNKPWKAILTYKTLLDKIERIEIDEPHEVEQFIRQAQEKMCVTSKAISPELITLRVESPADTAPDLTLIDLPGIARIAIEDQPKDICQQIKRIIMQHVQNENTVILCVIAANLDAAVNESIHIAKQVDSKGKRTFGVITKPDTADEEHKEEVLYLLNNQKIFLEKGYHMVKCRSQQELQDDLSLEESLEREKNFFKNDKYYRTANQELLGTMNLAHRITIELVQVIQRTLPGLIRKVDAKLQESEEKLARLPQDIPEGDQERLTFLIGLVKNLSSDINLFFTTGRISHIDQNIFYTWRKLYKEFTNEIKSMKFKSMSEEFNTANLSSQIRKRRGNEISGFLNFELFQALITEHVIPYKSKAEFTLNEIKDRTSFELCKIIENNFHHFPAIVEDLKKIVINQLDLANKETLDRINIAFEEESHVFAMDEEIDKKMTAPQNGQIQYSDATEMNRIMECYLNIVHVRLSDRIPMTIRQCLHFEFFKVVDRKFLQYCTTNGVHLKLMEDMKLRQERKNLRDKISRLKLARAEIRQL